MLVGKLPPNGVAEEKRSINTSIHMTKSKIALMAGIATVVAPFLAFADYATTTAITDVNTNISDVGSTIGGITPKLLALMAALIGLGWGVRKFRQHVSGRKF